MRLIRKQTIVVLIALSAVAYTGIAREQNSPLRMLADERGFMIGTAVAIGPLRNDPVYRDTIKREFNMIVAENAFKWESLRPSRTSFNFTAADALVDFAQSNGMRMRGHTLCWHKQLPAWLKDGTFTRDEAITILKEHIATLMGRYRGKVKDWDVVNEAVDETGKLRTDTFWYKTIGPDYIGLAFKFAREADPAARLYYNDFSAEGINPKSNGVYDLVRNLKSHGIPIDGVGWQMHEESGFHISQQHFANAKRLADLGLEISLTEMDFRIKLPSTDESLHQQANSYAESVNFCLKTLNCKAVLIWGFTDSRSWIPGWYQGFGEGLIFDNNYHPKLAYTAISAALEQDIASIPKITGVSKNGLSLSIIGERFDNGAELFINGEKQNEVSRSQMKSNAVLLAKKSGEKVKTGDLIKVRNAAGLVSNDFIYP